MTEHSVNHGTFVVERRYPAHSAKVFGAWADGAAKETWGNVKDAAGVTADRHQKEAERKADDARAGVRAKVDEVHDSVNERLDAHKASEREKAKTA